MGKIKIADGHDTLFSYLRGVQRVLISNFCFDCFFMVLLPFKNRQRNMPEKKMWKDKLMQFTASEFFYLCALPTMSFICNIFLEKEV